MRAAIQLLLQNAKLPGLENVVLKSSESPVQQPNHISPMNSVSEHRHSTIVVPPPMDMARDLSVDRDSADDSGLATVPMSSLYDLTRIRTLSSSVKWNPSAASHDQDFIAQGVVPLEEAEALFTRYMQDIRLYLWAGVLFPHENLDAVRRSSSLLTATVLTIAALHTPGRDDALQRCYNVFVSLTYNACLSRPQNLDDIRGQALGAFYFSNLSWKLSGLAVRNAVELNMHQSFQRLMRGREDQRENVRLWYCLYVCEHQNSIAWGRPPIIHEDVAIKNIEKFLDSPNTKPGDIRLAAQVSLFRILTEAYHTYGSDPEQPLTEPDFLQLRLFNLAIEQWRMSWQARSADSPVIGSYPSKGVVLYYHFARLQLNSLALRALPPPNAATSESLSYDRREAANIAISAATSTLTLIFEEPDIRWAMTAVPIFTHAMVAFCATFLLKMAKTWGGIAQAPSPEVVAEPMGLGLNFNVSQVLSLSRRSASFLAKVAENLNEKHLTRHIVQGINDLLKRVDEASTPAGAISRNKNIADSTSTMDFQPNAVPVNGMQNDTANLYDLIGSYGFGFDENFFGQVPATNLDFWETEPF